MHTKAVYRGAQEMTRLGFRTVRFNFRGVGLSTGTFEDGFGEEEDVRAALDWLDSELEGLPIVVGGLSFGSMVGLGVGVNDSRVKGMVAMGIPVHTYDYSYLGRTGKPTLIIQGEHDQFGTPSELQESLGHLGDHITIEGIRGSGHLFEGFFDEMRAVIREYFTSGPGAGILEPATETVRGTTP
jgi:alpha/beta superfamily hydrolase